MKEKGTKKGRNKFSLQFDDKPPGNELSRQVKSRKGNMRIIAAWIMVFLRNRQTR